jgi:hypothetical protein
MKNFSIALGCFSLIAYLSSGALADEKQLTPAESSFATLLETVLPASTKKADLPQVWDAKKHPGEKCKTAHFVIGTARTTSEKTAKIALVFNVSDDNDNPEEKGSIILYLSWYNNKWTVISHEESSIFLDNNWGRDRVLKLIRHIDE